MSMLGNSRYFTRREGFADDTAYVVVGPRMHVVRYPRNRYPQESTLTPQFVERAVARYGWVEITREEAERLRRRAEWL